MSKYSSDFLTELFKLTSRFDKPNFERAKSHLVTRKKVADQAISIDELRLLHRIRRAFSNNEEAVDFIHANLGDQVVSEATVKAALKLGGKIDVAVTSELPDGAREGKSYCPNCGVRILGNTKKCKNCNDKPPVTKKTSKSSGMGCGLSVIVGMIVILSLGLKSCYDSFFSEEAIEAAKTEMRDAERKRRSECVDAAGEKAARACRLNACDVGCQMKFLDDAWNINQCINNCRSLPYEQQVKICDEAESIVRDTAYGECSK